MICPKCGKEAAGSFCPACGERVVDLSSPVEKEKLRTGRFKVVLIVLTALVLTSAGLAYAAQTWGSSLIL